ncbi:MAG: RHS repeat-associated core domain-containing protein [Ruminococcaceae bacterium]|nr:RHS repeat-associated core domain-containing protein [Oscillospiraceae bacterium]
MDSGNTVYNRGLSLINRTNQNGTDYYHFNIHGDTIALTNLLGEITVNYQYDTFGNQLTNAENDTNPFRYCGEYFDQETGFIYLRNRYYDPSLGRFVTEDPIRDGENWYVYCSNNPVMFVDPEGLENIVVSGGKYGNDDPWPYEFIETALNKIWDWKENNPDETITWIVSMAGWTQKDIDNFKNAVYPEKSINVVAITDSEQLINYINSKDINSSSLSQARKDDTITDFALFSHGLLEGNGTIALGYGFSNSSNLKLSISQTNKMNTSAFSPNSVSEFYSCNTGTTGNKSFAQNWSNKTSGITYAFYGKSNYGKIHKGQSFGIWLSRQIRGFYWGGSWNLPIPGTELHEGIKPHMRKFTPN